MTMLISATITSQQNPLAKKPVIFPVSAIALIAEHEDKLLAQSEVHLLTGSVYLTKEPLHKMLAEMISSGAKPPAPENGLRMAPPESIEGESDTN